MAKPMAQSANLKPISNSNLPKKVRIVAKIRPYNDLEGKTMESESKHSSLKHWITVKKPIENEADYVTISFGDQPIGRKDSYKMDYCYEGNVGVKEVYEKEVKGLVREVLDGVSVAVIAYGARGCGKSYMIQGSKEKPGMAALAMDEILSSCERSGRVVKMSVYEVYQDHVFDLLHSSGREVLVLEDKQGKIQLKGLFEIAVKSISEFYKLYFHDTTADRPRQKAKNDFPRRSHKGLIVHIHNEDESKCVGKMSFVDLAGYEDTKRKSSDGSTLGETTWINKSLYTLQNVVKALNTDERVPYRESKLTRIMQHLLNGKNQTLMFTCLNPSFCQDTVYVASLASRSCEVGDPVCQDSVRKAKSAVRLIPPSPISSKPRPVYSSVKKAITQLRVVERKPRGAPQSLIRGRKLFNGAESPLVKSMSIKENCAPNIITSMEPSASPGEDVTLTKEHPGFEFSNEAECDAKPVVIREADVTLSKDHPGLEVADEAKCDGKAMVIHEGNKVEQENIDLLTDVSESPPLSQRLRELTESMRSILNSSTSVSPEFASNNQVCLDIIEPKTPAAEYGRSSVLTSHGKCSARSSGVKNTVVQNYLTFLNTATKDELKRSKGIGEKRATYILQCRDSSPEFFKDLDDLKDIGLSTKQINGMMKQVVGGLFD